jgi:predicted transcriptional regulator of viral defense system
LTLFDDLTLISGIFPLISCKTSNICDSPRVDTATFLQTRTVFSLDEADRALGAAGGRKGARERLKYAARQGRVKRVAGGVYATVPAGVSPKEFQADPFLVAATLRRDAIFTHHSALELLGAGHSEWRLCTAAAARRHSGIDLGGIELRFLSHPAVLARRGLSALGTRSVTRLDRELRVTGPERTLLDGFRQPELVGGLAELVESAAGFSVLDLELLVEVLDAYGQKKLWAAVGWFLDRHRSTFFADEALLERCAGEVPKKPQYLVRSERNGVLARRWNLMLPAHLVLAGEPDEPAS